MKKAGGGSKVHVQEPRRRLGVRLNLTTIQIAVTQNQATDLRINYPRTVVVLNLRMLMKKRDPKQLARLKEV